MEKLGLLEDRNLWAAIITASGVVLAGLLRVLAALISRRTAKEHRLMYQVVSPERRERSTKAGSATKTVAAVVLIIALVAGAVVWYNGQGLRSFHSSAPPAPVPTPIRIVSVNSEQQVPHQGQLGMVIHVDVETPGVNLPNGQIAVYFAAANGIALMDPHRPPFPPEQRHVYLQQPLPLTGAPGSRRHSLFMPYRQLYLEQLGVRGRIDLMFKVVLLGEQGRVLDSTTDQRFWVLWPPE